MDSFLLVIDNFDAEPVTPEKRRLLAIGYSVENDRFDVQEVPWRLAVMLAPKKVDDAMKLWRLWQAQHLGQKADAV